MKEQEYVICKSVTIYDEPKLGIDKVYKLIDRPHFIDDYLRIEVNGAPYSYPSYKFAHATEEDYLYQQPDPEEEANNRNKKLFNGVYSALKGMGDDWLEYYKAKIKEAGYYLITDKQIEELYNGLLSTEHPAADVQIENLKFLFPEAECFKEKEKTYKIGNRFRIKSKPEDILQLNFLGGQKVGMHDRDGRLLFGKLKVNNINKITREELDSLYPDLFDNCELID